VEVDEKAAGVSRDDVVTALRNQNVLAKKYFFPGCHRMEPYRSMPGVAQEPLPHTERLCQRLLQLPTGMAVSRDEIRRIGQFLRELVRPVRAAA
jgi:dTDP-4-amino-4,6-dideoxyglucose